MVPAQTMRVDAYQAASRFPNIALLAAFVLAASAVHVAIVAAYANPLPYSDEWIAIIDNVLRPAASGQFGVLDLFRPHNEHTMAPTRLLALVALWFNHGQFDNVPVALLNALLYALTMAVPVALFFRHAAGTAWLFALVLGGAALAPLEGEDLIFGFQNQYYFMLTGTVVTLWLAATATQPTKGALVKFAAVAMATAVSMGSGFFAALLGIAISALRWLREPQHRPALVRQMRIGAVVVVIGVALVAHAFSVMRQAGILGERHLDLDVVRRVFSCLAWPYGASAWLGFALSLPFAAFALHLLRRRELPRLDLLALGLGLWAGAQICALAFDRNSEATSLASRYLPVILFWPAMNVYATFRIAAAIGTRWPGRWTTALPLLPLLASAALISNVAKIVPASLAAVAVASQQHQMQAEHVARYVRLGDRDALYGAGHMQIPYPNVDKLRSLLDDPAVRAGLPANVRAPLALAPASAHPTVFVPFGAYVSVPHRDDLPGYGSFAATGNPTVGTFRSEALATEFPYVRIDLAGYLPDPGLTLELDCAAPATCPPLPIRPAEFARESWQGIYAAVPAPRFIVAATDRTPDLWMAFSAPVEVGRLSVLTDALINRLRGQAPIWISLGCGMLGLLLLAGLWRETALAPMPGDAPA